MLSPAYFTAGNLHMNKIPSCDLTVAYYNARASEFCVSTQGLDMAHMYSEFLPHIPKGGKILDAGCGSGRDAIEFKRRGYAVTAFDASSELAMLAGQALGEPVQVMTFLDLDACDEYDGIWACASLLHVPRHEIDAVISRLTSALKLGAPLYASFKYGSTERQHEGRFLNDYNESKFNAILANHPGLSLIKIWKTSDSRPDRPGELWLNTIVKRTMRAVGDHTALTAPEQRR
jgi:SAM-dependent methyltransferase